MLKLLQAPFSTKNKGRSSSDYNLEMKNKVCNADKLSIVSIEKENEQPNYPSPDKSGHIKSDTVICYSNDKWHKYLLENILESCISYKGFSPIESSCNLDGTDRNQNANSDEKSKTKDRYSPEMDVINALQESIKYQQKLESTILSLEEQKSSLLIEIDNLKVMLEKSDNQKKLILEQVICLQKEAGKSQDLSIKCLNYEKQLKEFQISSK